MMRLTLLSLFLAPAVFSSAQQVSPSALAAGSDWQHVQALPVGTSIYLQANHKTSKCMVTTVDADTLTCTRGKDITFQRTEIDSIKLPHRGRSSLILSGIGAGVGVAVVKAVASSSLFGAPAKGGVYAGGAGMGAIMFWPLGYITDPARSTIYKAR